MLQFILLITWFNGDTNQTGVSPFLLGCVCSGTWQTNWETEAIKRPCSQSLLCTLNKFCFARFAAGERWHGSHKKKTNAVKSLRDFPLYWHLPPVSLACLLAFALQTVGWFVTQSLLWAVNLSFHFTLCICSVNLWWRVMWSGDISLFFTECWQVCC